MTKCLFVVLGAGASYASTSTDNVDPNGLGLNVAGNDRPLTGSHLQPPLVTQLFQPRFAGILNKYPMAQMAASDIRKQTQTPVAIEDFLRERYWDSEDPLDRRKFHAVHWYLQDLLWTVSKYYTKHPDNYDRLITGCLRLPRVVFITLNYDTLLDDRLRIVQPIDSLAGYTLPDSKWSLIKLHGSVDWGRPIAGSSVFGREIVLNTPATVDVTDQIVLRRQGVGIEDIRLERMGSQWFYPAMSVPVGTRDEFSCPPEHVDYLRQAMAEQDELDVLVVGYSGLDDEVLKLFKDSGKSLKSICVVNADRDSARDAYGRLTNRLGQATRGPGTFYDGSFAKFVGTDEFDKYLTMIKNPRR